MFRAMRRNSVVPFVMLLLMVGSIPMQASALLHDDARDPCEPALVIHDESAHRIGAPHGRAPVPEHCAICHWLQSHRSVESVTGVTQPLDEFRSITLVPIVEIGVGSYAQLPARAPPAV